MKALLVLEDGSFFEGSALGAAGERIGRVVLNTAVVGYQEIMTDPANAGKILVLTYPLIGNYGIAKKFYESGKCRLNGLIIKEASRRYSNWQAEASFEDFLEKEGLLAVSGIDTRTLAVNIRDKGEIFGMLSTGDETKEALLKRIREHKASATTDHIKDISVKKPTDAASGHKGPRIAILDLGVTASVLRQLKALRLNLTLLPYDTDHTGILAMRPDGLIISNGPEDDVSIPNIVKNIRHILGAIPLFGISTGHEIIGLALGGKLERMKTGHHGVNYPVKAADSYKGEITVQNHSFVINENSLKGRRDIRVTLRNVNDKTIEEMESKALRFISTQYYPSSPGFEEVNGAFVRFLKMVRGGKVKRAEA